MTPLAATAYFSVRNLKSVALDLVIHSTKPQPIGAAFAELADTLVDGALHGLSSRSASLPISEQLLFVVEHMFEAAAPIDLGNPRAYLEQRVGDAVLVLEKLNEQTLAMILGDFMFTLPVPIRSAAFDLLVEGRPPKEIADKFGVPIAEVEGIVAVVLYSGMGEDLA